LSPTADALPDTLPTSIQATGGATDTSNQPDLVSRILILSVSADLSTQYIPIMNAIFAAQRRHIPIDVLKLAGDTGFLQQACDATGGVYMDLSSSSTLQDGPAMLQYLMMAYLPDSTARRWLVMPGGEEVDFRAACFCHQRVVDLGYVCSVCLSIFCEPMADGVCLTCGTLLELPAGYNVTPAVVPKRKKKKKRPGSGIGTPMDAGTPTPG
jgi:transcription initiation factor TFIIH subunit 3